MTTFFLILRCVLLSFATVAALHVSAHAQGQWASKNLSDMLAQKIIDAQKAESERLFELALGNYGEALGLSGDTPAGVRLILKKRAALLEQIGMPARAEADLTAAINMEPFDPKAIADRGYFYIRQQRYSEALDDFVKGNRSAPTDPMFPYGAARSLIASGDYTNATKFYAEAIKLSPHDGKLFLGRAEALVNQKRMDEALADYNRAFAFGITEKTDRFYAHTGRGYISLMDGDFNIAVQSLSNALEISPGASNVMLWRGYAYERMGKRDLALKDFQNALAAGPASDEMRSSLARLRSQMMQAGTVPPAEVKR